MLVTEAMDLTYYFHSKKKRDKYEKDNESEEIEVLDELDNNKKEEIEILDF